MGLSEYYILMNQRASLHMNLVEGAIEHAALAKHIGLWNILGRCFSSNSLRNSPCRSTALENSHMFVSFCE